MPTQDAIANLGVAAQRGAGQPVVGVGVEVAPVAFAVLAGDVGQHPGPARHRRLRGRGAAGELGEKRRG